MRVLELRLNIDLDILDSGRSLRTKHHRVPGGWSVTTHWGHRVFFCRLGECQVMVPFESCQSVVFDGEPPRTAGRPAKGGDSA